MEFLALLSVAVIIAMIVFPIWTIVRISALTNELRQTRAEIDRLRKQGPTPTVQPAEVPSTPQPPPVETVQPAVTTPPPVVVAPPPIVAPSPVSIEPPPPIIAPTPEPLAAQTQVPPTLPIPEPTPVAPATSSQPAPETPVTPPTLQPKPAFNWEIFMGTKLIAWLGGLAAFLAVAFFLKYSVEHDLISREVRAAMGFVFGAGMIVGGLWMARKKYDITAHTLCAIGIVSLYGVTFACKALYHFPFFGLIPTFALMALVTTVAFLLSVRLNGKFIAILGILGGFLTPKLLSTGVDNPLGLFGYIALLNIGLYAVALNRRWNFLVPLGAVGTAVIQVGWAVTFLGDHNTFTAIIVCLVFNALFLGGFVVARKLHATEGKLPEALSGSVVFTVIVSFGFALYFILESFVAYTPLWLFGFMLLADLCILVLCLLDKRSSKFQLLSGLLVFLLLGVWTVVTTDHHSVGTTLLPWALGAYFVFALIHSAFPMVLARARNETTPSAWANLFPAFALILVLVPVTLQPSVPFMVWPAILLIDLLAIILASFSASLVGVALALLLTLVTAACWIFKIPANAINNVPAGLLVTIGGFAVLFFAASLWLGRKITARFPHLQKDGSSTQTLLPAMSSLLPFVLLVMAEVRLNQIDPTPIFGLGLLLTILTLGLSRITGKQGQWLPLVALAGILMVAYAWQQTATYVGHLSTSAELFFSPTNNARPGSFAFVALAWSIGYYAIFTAFPFAFRNAFSNTRGPWIAAAAAGPLFFPLVHHLIKTNWPNEVMGLVPLAFAVPALLCLMLTLRLESPENPHRLGRLALFGGVTLLFISLVFPIQFSRQWITLGWALEGAAVLWLYSRVSHRGLPIAGILLLVVAFIRLALNPAVLSYFPRSEVVIFNWFLYTYGIVAICMFAGAHFVKATQFRLGSVGPGPFSAFLNALGILLVFLLLNIEIADYFTEPGSRALMFEFSGNFARDMTYTISWALFAFILLVLGIWQKNRGARYVSLGLLVIVLAKLFLHDLASLDTLYRVAALLAVAVITILASFLYQKFLTPKSHN